MVLSYEVYLIAKQIRKWYVIPSDEGIELTNELHAWATQVSLKSPFTQAMLMCREHLYELIRVLEELVNFSKNQYSLKNAVYKIPDIVSTTD